MGQTSRFHLTQAIVEDQSFVVDRFIEGNIDWSFHDGHYYTNKAPGVSFIGVPFYWMMKQIERLFASPDTNWSYRNLRWTDVAITALPSALAAFLMLLYLLSFATSEQSAWNSVFSYSVASIAFPFSTMLWGHQTAAAFLFAAFFFIVGKGRGFWGGVFLGLAVLSEYSTAISVPAFAAYFLFSERFAKNRSKSILLFIAGGLPFLVLFAWYHTVCFGGPFQLAPKFQNPAHGLEVGSKLFGVLGIPKWIAIRELLIGDTRGLFLISPALGLAFAGLFVWLRKSTNKLDAMVCLWIFVGFLLFNSSYNAWEAGRSSGPRYLLPAVPFVAVGLIMFRNNLLVSALTLAGMVNAAAISAVGTGAMPGRPLLTEEIYPKLISEHRLIWPFLPIVLMSVTLFLVSQWKGTKPSDSR